MKLTQIEECMLLAHRVNKLGGCVFVYDGAHVGWVDFSIRPSVKDYENKVYGLKVRYNNTKFDEDKSNFVDATDDLEHLKGTLEGMISDLKGEAE